MVVFVKCTCSKVTCLGVKVPSVVQVIFAVGGIEGFDFLLPKGSLPRHIEGILGDLSMVGEVLNGCGCGLGDVELSVQARKNVTIKSYRERLRIAELTSL